MFMFKKYLILVPAIIIILCGIINIGLPRVTYAMASDENPFTLMDRAHDESISIAKGKGSEKSSLKNKLSEDKKKQKEKEKELLADPGKRYIVKFNDNVSMQQIYETVSLYKYELIGKSERRMFMLKLDDMADFEQRATGLIEFIEEDKEKKTSAIPLDTYYQQQWALPAINMPKAWDINKGSNSVLVAVIDSGVNRNQPDLVGADIRNGWDYIFSGFCDWDSIGHGTNVTGIIGAQTNNAIGIAGINWNVAIIPLRVVYSSGTIYNSDVIAAIYDAADLGSDVINLSLGGTYYSTAENSAISYAISKGSIVVAAAGNDGTSIYEYPASYNGVISVGSIDRNLTHSYFSQFNDKVDVTAPGSSIYTTADWLNVGYGNDYVYADGTSFSSPHVSGIAALATACDPSLTAEKFENLIKATSTDLGTPGYDNYYGYGLINAEKLLRDIVAPAVPSGFQLATESDRQITLTWTTNSEPDLGGYQLEYKAATASTWSIACSSLSVATTTYTITGLINGTNYQFRLKATDVLGNWSEYTEIITGVPVDNVAPPVPVGLKVSSVNDQQVTLGWTAVSATDLAGYNIMYKKTSEDTWTEVSVGKVATWTISSLSNGEEYSFQIKARDTSGNSSAASAMVNGTPADLMAPAVPTGLTATIGVDKDVNLTWNANTEADLGGYEIAYQKYGTITWVTQAVDAVETGTTIEGLVQNVSYTFKIRAGDQLGNWSVYSAVVKATPKDLTAPATPTGFTAQAKDRAIQLTWTANSEADLGGYQLEYRLSSATTWSIASSSLSKTTTTFTKTGLVNGTTYQFRLKAKDTSGNWSGYTEITGVPADNVAPPVPAGLKVSSVNDQQATLGWSTVSSADLAGYQIEYKETSDSTWSKVTVGKVITSTITGLTNGIEYSFRIEAKDTSGNLSVASAIVTGIPLDKLAPAVPKGLKAVSGSYLNVNLTWTGNTEADLAGYEIAYLKSGTTAWTSVAIAAGSTGTTIEGLIKGASYSFKIRAKDLVNNYSTYSTSVSATAKDMIAPDTPIGLTAQAKDRAVQLTWTANSETDLGSYQLEYKLSTASTWSIASSSLSKATTTYTKTGLVNGKTYQFRLKAKDTSNNWSGYTGIISGIPAL